MAQRRRSASGRMAKVGGALAAIAAALTIAFYVPPLLATEYRCWDETLVANWHDCTAPVGSRGMLWFFESLASSEGGCEYRQPNLAGKQATWICPFERGRDRGLIRYSAWPDTASARDYYNRQFDEPFRIQHLEGEGVGYRWDTDRSTTVEGLPFKRAGSFYTASFSWTVAASTLAGLEHGASLVAIRDVEHWTYVGPESKWSRFVNRLGF